MKHLNFLSKSSSQSRSHRVTTLALTVGSPSAHRRGTMLRLLSVLVLILTLGVGNVWGAVNDVVASVNPTADLDAGTAYEPASNDYWAVNVTNNSAFGTNAKSGNNAKLKLSNNDDVSTRNTAIATALAAYTETEFTVETQYVAALIGLTSLSNVGKVGVTYGGTNGGAPDDMWVLYSINSGSTYSVAGHASSVSSGTNITFTSTISSAQYAVVFKRSAAFGIKNTPTITFYEGATATSYTITAQSSNNTYGTVSLEGSVITATPAANCRIASTAYNVTSGTATIARGTGENINKFTVTPSSNCTVRINFEQIPTHKISFNTGGLVVIDDATGIKEGDTYNIIQTPAASLTDNCEYGTFVGWTTASSIANASVCPSIVTSVTMSTSDVTLYAVYSKTVGGTGASVGTTMWAESFADYDANDKPETPGASATKYNNASINYAYTNGNGTSPGTTKVATSDIGAGGEAPELMIGKKGSGNSATTGGSFSISGIPSGGATTLTLSYRKNNRTISNPSITGTGYSISAPTGSNPYTCTITCGSATSFDLTFTATTTYNVRMDDFSVIVATTTNAGTTTYSLDANCCQPLAQINGSVSLIQTTAALEWADLDHVSSWAVQYKEHSAENWNTWNGEQATADSKRSVTITGLTCGTAYDFKIAATAESGNCDAEQVLEDKSTTKWNISYNLTNTVEKTAGPETGANACGEITAIFSKNDLYSFPENITVTIGGEEATAETDYLWDDSEGTLVIYAAAVTGNVAVTIAGVAPANPIVTPSPSALSFVQVKKGAAVPAAKDITITGQNLTKDLTVTSSDPTLYAVSVKSGSLIPDGDKNASPVITVTPREGITSTAGDKNATITISGGGLSEDVVVNVTFNVQETYTVNFYINSTTTPAVDPQTDVQGTALTVPTVNVAGIDDCADADYEFMGWTNTSNYTYGTSDLITNTAGLAIGNADVNYYAVFALKEGEDGYAKVTAVNQLTAGDKIIITGYKSSTTTYYGMKAYVSGNNCGQAEISIENDKITSLGDACELTLGGTTNAWTFYDGTYYIYAAGAATSKQNYMKGKETSDDECLWSIAIENGETSVTSNENTYVPHMQYNNSNGLFSCYNTASQSPVTLYKKESATYSDYRLVCPHCNTVELVTAYGSNPAHGSITLKQGETEVSAPVETCERSVTINVTETHDTGYQLLAINLDGVDNATYSANNHTITIPQNGDGTLTATATFTQVNYTVTMAQTGGANATLSENQSTKHYGDEISISTTTPEGYTFLGWSADPSVTYVEDYDASMASTKFNMPAANVTMTANFQEIPVDPATVTFNAGAGELVCNACTNGTLTEASAGAGVTLPSCTPETGYAFLGWTAMQNKETIDDGAVSGATYYPAADMPLYAVYAQLTTVTLKKGNGTDDVVLYADVTTGKVTLPSRSSKNQNYTFAGWSTKHYSTEQEDANPSIIEAGEYTPDDDIILYPVFSVQVPFTVWTKKTVAQVDGAGTYAIIDEDGYAFNGTMSSGHGQGTASAFEFTNNVATAAPTGTCELTFTAVTGGYTLYNETYGYLYATKASSGGLAWHASEDSYWKIHTDDNWLYDANSAYLRTYVSGTSHTFRTYSGSSNNALYFAKKESQNVTKYNAAPANAVAAPTFTLAAGAYYGAQEVTISSETDNVAIYYTEDGSVPSDQSTEFTGAFSVSSSKTIKAIAIDEDGYSSAVAEAAYTIYPVYNSIAAYQAASAQEAATARVVINKESANAIVIGVTGKYTYVQDGTAAMVIQRPNTQDPWTVGDELGGYLQGTRDTYYGLPMITVADVANVSASEGTPITAQTVSNLDFAGVWSSYAGNLIKVSDVYFQAQATSDRIVALADGAEHTGAIYDALFKINGANLPLTETACDITGILVARTENEVTTHYIAPTALTDISTKGAVAQLNVSPVGGADAEHAKGIAPGGQVTVTPVDGFATTLNGEAIDAISTVDVTAPTSITVSASRQFYTDNNQLYYYEVDESYMPVTVTQPANAGGSTISADKTSAQENDVVTLSRNVAEHYHFNAWNVYKTGDAGTTVTVTNDQFNMPAYAVTVEADIEEDAYATVVFDGGDATGTAPASEKKYVGQEVTMPNKGALVKADHVLASWTYNETEYAVGGTYEIQEGDAAIGGNEITFTAHWTPYPWANGGDWMLVTDAAEVTVGSYVIIAAAASNVAMSTTQNNNNRAQQSISKTDNLLTYETAPAIFEVRAGNIENTLAFYDVVKEGYIYAASSGSNHLKTETTLSDNSSWTIEINGDNEAALEAQGTNTRNTLRHNNGSSIFSCYGSSSSESPIALYKYYAPVPKVTYDKNTTDEVTNMPNPSVQRAENNKATIAAGPSRTGYSFEGWNSAIAGDGDAYTVGQEYTISEDITLYAQWDALPTFTVSYSANGGIGDAPAAQATAYQGETITLLENTFTNPGMAFDGWKVTYNNGTEQEIEVEDNQFTMPAYDVVIKAVWSTQSNQKWLLVTDASELEAGKKYVIAAAGDKEYAMSTNQKSNNRGQTAIVKNGNEMTGSNSMQIITLGGSANTWEFYTGSGYLYAASSGSNYLRTQAEIDDNGRWTISISTDGEGVTSASIVANGTNTRNILQYNSGDELFSCYGSASQSPVAIYREKELTKITENSSASVPDGNDLEIGEDVIWTVSSNQSVGDLHLNEGAIVANSAEVTANDLYFKTKAGKSNQIFDANQLNVIGDLYYDVQLCDGDLDADYWYSIAVPFDVNLNNGVFLADGTSMVNRVDFEVWGYDTQLRAQTQSNGWKRVTDNMMHAGKAYLIGFNPGQPNIIRLKAAEGWKDHLFSGTSMSVTSTGGIGTHDNWNGLANPTMRYIDIDKPAQVFNNDNHSFDPFSYDALAYNFVVGTAFFVQSPDAVAITTETDHGQYRAPKRVDETKCAYAVRITREDAKDFDNQIIVRASEEATGTYTQGHDMLTMNGTSSNTAALLWTENYGGKRLAIEEAAWLNDQASYALNMYAPKAGTYSISVAETKDNADLYLTQDGAIIWNLSMGAYELSLNKGLTNNYGLLLIKKAPGIATGVDEISGEKAGVQKIVIEDKVFILRGGKMYDVTGKMVK